MSDALLVEGLSAGYPKRRVLDGLTLAPITPGTVCALVGPNGAGKSTLLKGLAGLVPATGSARLGSLELLSLSRRDRARVVTFMPQTLPEQVALNVLESVMAALRVAPFEADAHGGADLQVGPHSAGLKAGPSMTGSTVEERAYDVLSRVGLAERALDRLDQLSGGQRQLAGLAQAIVRDPKVLLLDEPTSALDLRHQVVVMDLVSTLAREGRIVVVVLHDLSLAARWSDHLVVLRDGKVEAEGHPAQALTSDVLARAYGVEGRVEACSRGRVVVMVDGVRAR